MLAHDAKASLLTIAEEACVMAHLLVPEFDAEVCEVVIAGERKSVGQVRRTFAEELDGADALHQTFFQASESDGNFDGRAGLEAATEG